MINFKFILSFHIAEYNDKNRIKVSKCVGRQNSKGKEGGQQILYVFDHWLPMSTTIN